MMRRALPFLLLVASSVRAEERSFLITIDRKPAGTVSLSYEALSDGTVRVSVQADIAAWIYRGTEVWKKGRLERLDGSGSDSGRKGGITLQSHGDGYDLKAGAREVGVRGEVWPGTFAVRPDLDRQPLHIDVLTGEVTRTKVEPMGPDRVTVGGKPVPATRYRLTVGGNLSDVWYDDRGRLVRRAWAAQGRPVVLELVRLPSESR